MPSRAVNLALLAVLAIAIVSGFASLLAGAPSGRWVFWLHRAVALALVPLLYWKWRIVMRGYRRRGLTAGTALSGLFTALVLGSLLSGILWATTGLRGLRLPLLGSLTGLGLHITLSIALIPLVLAHAATRWPRLRRPDFVSRRAALRYLALSAAGAALWQSAEAATRLARLSGARRRFTGSRERGSLRGNRFPTTNWLTDPMPRIASAEWELRVHGAIAHEAVLTYDQLLDLPADRRRVLLDCTGGWYSVQDWTGVPLRALLDRAGIAGDARSLVVRSATGYTRRFPLDQSGELLLATHVGDELLSRGHGYPARLVAPGQRGFNWVKWVVALEVSTLPSWLESPLPPR
jgi:hypothetical protein